MINQTTKQLVERFIVHVLLIMLAAGFMYVEQWISGQNFGAYQALAVSANAILFNFVEKFFVSQGIELPPGTVLAQAESSSNSQNS